MQYLYKLRIDKHKHTHKIILFLNLETRFKARLSWIQSFGVRTKFPGVKRNELPEPRPALRWPPHVPGPLCARAGCALAKRHAEPEPGVSQTPAEQRGRREALPHGSDI